MQTPHAGNQGIPPNPNQNLDSRQSPNPNLGSSQQVFQAQAPNQKYRVHHSYIWLSSLRILGYFLLIFLISGVGSVIGIIEEIGSSTNSYDSTSDAIVYMIIGGIIFGILILIFGIVVGLQALSYKFLWYEVGTEEFSLYSGILVKKRVHIPYQKIQSVDQRATLIQRIFGVCSVSIDTAGGANNKAVLVPYLTKSQAQALKEDLYLRRQRAMTGNYQVQDQAIANTQSANVLDIGEQAWNQIGGVFAGNDVALEKVKCEYSLNNKELFLSGLSNSSGFAVAVLVVIAAITQIFGMIFDFMPGSEDDIADAIVNSAVDFGISQVVGFTIGGILFIAVIVWAFSILNSVLSFGGFHARRRGDRIEVERGLLQHQTQSVSVQRIQSIIIKQSFIRKLIGYCELSLGKIDAVVESEQSSNKQLTAGGIVLHPFLKLNKVNEVISSMIPEYADIPSELISVSPKALRRGIARRSIWQGGGFWLALIMLCTQISFNIFAPIVMIDEGASYLDVEFALSIFAGISVFVYAICVVLFVLDIIGAILWYRSSGFSVNRRFMLVKNSGFSTQTNVFPRTKIQFGYTRTNPLQRLACTSTLCAVSAAGTSGGTTISLVDVDTQAAMQWLEWMKPKV